MTRSPFLLMRSDAALQLLLGEELLRLAVREAHDDLVGGRGGALPVDVEAGGAEVRGDEDAVPGGPHGRQEGGRLQLDGVQVGERLLAEALDQLLVVLHHVGGQGAVEGAGDLDRVVHGVLYQRPGGEGGARHQDGAVEQTCERVSDGNNKYIITQLEICQPK